MYKNNHTSQYNECLICLKSIENISLSEIVFGYKICTHCLSQFESIHYHGTIDGVPLTILYRYNEFFRKLLYQFKGQYDYPLKDTFLVPYVKEYRKKYKDYLIVIAPSDKESNKIRGFNPNLALASTFSSHIFEGLFKTVAHKQALQKYEDREKVRDVISIKGGERICHKKVLLFDDVITSSNTISRCIELVKMYEPKSIEVLILSTKSYDKT